MLLPQLRGATVLAIGESPVTGMKTTGIPPHLAVLRKHWKFAHIVLSKKHDIKPQHRMRHSRVREVMGLIQKVAEESPVFPAGVTKIYHLDLQTADKAFCTILETMLAKLYRDTIIAL
ncbi:hypothetical protein F443_22602, partial [Phytophthora nicotianae P1569]